MLYYKLETGKQLTTEEFDNIINDTVFAKARDKAVRFLSYRERSKKELLDKLKSYDDFPDDVITRVIDLMEKYGYIDDFKFATLYIKEKTNLNYCGRLRINSELKQKGVENKYIENAYAILDIDEIDVARKAVQKKYKNGLPSDQKEKKRAYNFLLRKGFDYEVINEIFEEK